METTIYRTIKGSEMEKMFDTTFDELSIRYYNATDLIDSDVYDNRLNYKFEIKIRHGEGTKASKIFDVEYDKLFKSINSIDNTIDNSIKEKVKFMVVYDELNEWVKSKGFIQTALNTEADYAYSFYDDLVEGGALLGVECFTNEILKLRIRFISGTTKHEIRLVDTFSYSDLLTITEFKCKVIDLLRAKRDELCELFNYADNLLN